MHEFSCEHALAFVADSRIGMALVDPDFKFVAVNAAYCKILNAPRELIIGHTFRDFTHKDDIELDEQYAAKLKLGEESYYEFAKRYIRRGSTPQKQMIVWGLLRVESIWGTEAVPVFQGFRVTFEPFESVPKRGIDWTWLRDDCVWVSENWKTAVTILAIVTSITGVGGAKLLQVLHEVKQVRSSVESELPSSQLDSLSP